MTTWSSATLAGAVGRLALMLSPLGGLWVLVCTLLLLQESALAHLLAIGLFAAGPVIAWRLAKSCSVEVPRHRSLIVENRNTHQIEVLLTGYHGSLPGLYRDRLWTQIQTAYRQRILENVGLSAGPALTLRITYTLQHAIPSRTLRLPRPGLSASAFQQATRIAANIFLEAQDTAEWNRRQDLVLDRCLRTFFADVPSTDLYDPTGSARRAPHILYCRLHDYLTEHMEREDGIRVHIDHLEVLVHPQQATHARADLRRVA